MGTGKVKDSGKARTERAITLCRISKDTWRLPSLRVFSGFLVGKLYLLTILDVVNSVNLNVDGYGYVEELMGHTVDFQFHFHHSHLAIPNTYENLSLPTKTLTFVSLQKP